MDDLAQELHLAGLGGFLNEPDLMYHELSCPNCSNFTRGMFEEQDDNDLYTCMSCGLCNIERTSLNYKQIESNRSIQNFISSIPDKVSRKGTPHTGNNSYDRAFHLMERLRQYYLLEPRIDPLIEEAIRTASELYRRTHYYYNYLLSQRNRLKKTDIKSLLRFMTNLAKSQEERVDQQGYWTKDMLFYEITMKDLHNRSFCTVLLEKWKSIVMLLQPDLPPEKQFRFMTENQVIRLEYKFRLYSNIWEELRWKRLLPLKRVGGHFPNFNTMILKICQEEKIPMSVDEFPPLSTPRTKKEFDFAYDLIRKHTPLVQNYLNPPPVKKQLKLL